jgi:hypothetical protein
MQGEAPVTHDVARLQQNWPAMGTYMRTAGTDLDFAGIDEQPGAVGIDDVLQCLVGRLSRGPRPGSDSGCDVNGVI